MAWIPIKEIKLFGKTSYPEASDFEKDFKIFPLHSLHLPCPTCVRACPSLFPT